MMNVVLWVLATVGALALLGFLYFLLYRVLRDLFFYFRTIWDVLNTVLGDNEAVRSALEEGLKDALKGKKEGESE